MTPSLQYRLLNCIRALYTRIQPVHNPVPSYCDNADQVSRAISERLTDPDPVMIARFGSNELNALVNYIGITSHEHHPIDYIRGEALPWWWETRIRQMLHDDAGFFPDEEGALSDFGRLMLSQLSQVDILGSWRPEEKWVTSLMPNSLRVRLRYLEPFYATTPWTHCLTGKKVLVIHPFIDSIKHQYAKREKLFASQEMLPAFDLKTLRSVQTVGNSTGGYDTWFDALQHMMNQMDAIDYDIVLIGCGAYGFPLAAHAKQTGHKAVHLGGALQLLFGIKGQRWDNSGLYNEDWIRPLPTDIDPSLKRVENGCYL